MLLSRATIGLLLVAAALRLAVVWTTADSGLFADMAQYQERAAHLVQTGSLYPDALRGPGYPGLLAAVYWLVGEPSLWAARLLNVGLGTLMVLLTAMLSRQAGAGRGAWIAGAIVALYPAWLLFATYLMPEGLYTVLALLTLVLLAQASLWSWAIAGAVCGAAVLTRSVGVALVATAIVVTFVAVPPVPLVRRFARLGVFAAVCAAVLAPWLAFTTRMTGGPLLDSTSGFNLLAGNNPRATGRLELDQGEWLNATYISGAASVSAGNGKAIAAGVGWARDHPREWLRLAGAKVGYLFGLDGREHAWLYGHAYFGARSTAVIWAWGLALMVSFPLLAVTAALGAGRAVVPRESSHVAMVAFLVATTLLHVASFGESRFHLPLVPILAVAASLGATRRESWRSWRLASAALVLLFLASAWITQARELGGALPALSQPGGSTSTPRY